MQAVRPPKFWLLIFSAWSAFPHHSGLERI
jgi:hypothetical protein